MGYMGYTGCMGCMGCMGCIGLLGCDGHVTSLNGSGRKRRGSGIAAYGWPNYADLITPFPTINGYFILIISCWRFGFWDEQQFLSDTHFLSAVFFLFLI